jgi:hypothetical protein
LQNKKCKVQKLKLLFLTWLLRQSPDFLFASFNFQFAIFNLQFPLTSLKT